MKIVYKRGVPLELKAKDGVVFPLTPIKYEEAGRSFVEFYSYCKPNQWNVIVDVRRHDMTLEFSKTDENGQAYTINWSYLINKPPYFTGEIEPEFYSKE